MSRRHTLIVTALLSAATFTSCERFDLVGMIAARSTTEDRVAQWLSYNATHGEQAIYGAPDSYTFYSASDTHYTPDIEPFGPSDRIYHYVTANRNDSLALFAIIVGDIVGTKGEEQFKLVERSLSYHPSTQSVYKPCFTAIGNHDISFDCLDYYAQYFHTSTYTLTVHTRSGLKDLYIFLDSANGTHGPTQLSWLEQHLSRRDDYRHLIVVTHNWLFRTSYDYTQPPCSNLPLEEQYALMTLMSDHDVSLMLMGHAHHCEARIINGVHYVMTDNMNEDRDIPTYLTVRCGEQLTYQYKELTVQ